MLVGCSPELTGTYEVVKVIDGDTVDLDNGVRIRFSGINTPEISKGDCYAKEAKAFLSDLILNKEVYLEKDFAAKDIYGRSLKYVYFKNVNINLLLVEEGYAEVFAVFSNTTYYEELVELENEARKENKGLWSCDGRSFTEIKKEKINWKKLLLTSNWD